MKRIFDIIVATFAFLLVLPILGLAVLVIRFTSKGTAFFAHERCGRDGVPFHCLKLRTMVPDAQHWLAQDPSLRAKYRENGFKLGAKEDPRVTSVGQFLRRSHLDELPQLINVIRGDMSLVGPRPIIDEELEWYEGDELELLSVSPGIFGSWTAMGRKRSDYPARAEVELSYVRETSWHKDLRLLWRHIPVLLVGQPEE